MYSRRRLVQVALVMSGLILIFNMKVGISFADNQALSLSKVGDYVEVLDDTTLDITGAITLAAWVKVNSLGNPYVILTKGGAGIPSDGINYAFSIRPTGQVNLSVRPSDGIFYSVPSTDTINAGEWQYVAVTFDENNANFYIGGSADSEGPKAFPHRMVTNTAHLVIGTFDDNGHIESFFDGLLDEVSIWNRVLEPSDIQANMNGLTGSEPGLVAYYRFDELNDDGEVPDLSIDPNTEMFNGNDGTLVGDATLVAPGAPIAPGQVDLAVLDVIPIQVVENIDVNNDGRIDLVQDKPMVVRVKTQIDNPEAVPEGQLITTRLNFHDIQLSRPHTVQELENNNFFVEFFFPPSDLGDFTIIAHIDPLDDIPEPDETNNEATAKVTVKDTNGLHIIYLPVIHISQLSEYKETVDKSGEFIRGTYPIAPNELINEQINEPYAYSDRSFEPDPRLDVDFIRLWLQGRLLSGSADRIVGVAPKEFFEFHSGCTSPNIPKGKSRRPIRFARDIKSMFVLEGHWTAVAHEIGHTYGFGEDYKSTKTGCDITIHKHGDPASGYWVEAPEGEPKERNTFGFMGTSPGEHSFDRWVKSDHFKQLFENFLVNKSDPEVLLVSGLVHPDGKIEMMPLYKLSEGIADEVSLGDYSVQLLDVQGQLIQETKFSVSHTTFTNPFPPIESDTGIFAFAIPYPENVQELRILRDDVPIKEIVVGTQLLHDAIDAIPEFGFEEDPNETRQELHEQVDGAEEEIRGGELDDAIVELQDLRDDLEEELIDYEKENILQYSKQEIHDLVDEVVSRLQAQIMIVEIDIKPGSYENPINLKSKGVIPVAVLSTGNFDATTVEGSSVRFGPGEAEPKHGDGHLEDVDNDGDIDWLGHFPTQDAGFTGDETESSITGKTQNGQEFNGSDLVTLVGNAQKAPMAMTIVPTETHVLTPFPSPSNPETWIPYHLAQPADVLIRIYDAQGHLVRTLNLGHQQAGFYTTRDQAGYWNGRNDAGERVSSGPYFYHFQAGEFTAIKKMFLLK